MTETSVEATVVRVCLLRTGVRVLALAVSSILASSSAQAQTARAPAQPPHQPTKQPRPSRSKAAVALAKEPLVATPAPPPPPPRPLAPEKMPPQVPQVVWDGKQLTINADNSTLSDILVSVRLLTGAEVDVPPSAAQERIAARLGPGPAREVLSTLLSWTSFNFVIQASDSDPLAVGSIVLTPRSKGETVVASNIAPSPAESPRSAYHRAGRPVLESAERTQESEAVPQPEASEATPPATPAASADAQVAAATTPKPATELASAPADAQANSSDSQQQGDLRSAASAADTGQTPAASNPVQEKIQQMQSMFEQRKQMIIDARKPPQN